MTRRLVFLTPGYSDSGGVARRSQTLSSALAERGWRVLVVARAPHLWHPRLIRRGLLTVFEVPGFGVDRLGSVLFLLTALPLGTLQGVRGSSFLAIKLMSSSSTAAVCGILTRRPFISMATSSGFESEVAFLLGQDGLDAEDEPTSHDRVGLRLRRHLLRRAAFVVAQTPVAGDDLAHLVERDRIVVLPNPIQVTDPAPLTGKPRAVFTGRLSRHKDPLTMVKAWRIVLEQCPEARLTVVGEGGRHESVETEVRRLVGADPLLRHSVRLTGWVPDVTPHLLGADVFLLPSLTEGMSNSLLEACAYGRVVVASDIPANRVVLGDDYPLLFPAGNAAALATVILRAFEDEALRSEVTTRIATGIQEFSIDRVVDRLEEVIRRAASGSERPEARG